MLVVGACAGENESSRGREKRIKKKKVMSRFGWEVGRLRVVFLSKRKKEELKNRNLN